MCEGWAKQGQGDGELSRRMVTAVSLQECSCGRGVCGVGGAGARHQERSRRMVSDISLCGSMYHCDRALVRLERTGRERAVSLKS